MEDQVTPQGKWKFDEEVSKCFDNMLARSIPQYDLMRVLVRDIAAEFMHGTSFAIDLGTSTGKVIQIMIKTFPSRCTYLGLEISDAMLKQASINLREEIRSLQVRLMKHDLRTGLPKGLEPASVIFSILTLQFTPIEYRPHIVSSVYDQLEPGGAFIVVEKIMGQTAKFDAIMTNLYLDMKGGNGYSQEQIDRKRFALEGVLVPVTAKWNEELLTNAGFKHVECFWRWLNFAGWIGVKI